MRCEWNAGIHGIGRGHGVVSWTCDSGASAKLVLARVKLLDTARHDEITATHWAQRTVKLTRIDRRAQIDWRTYDEKRLQEKKLLRT